jgi:hypothetical protein
MRLTDAPTSRELYLLAARNGRAFYRVGAPTSNCFAVGDVAAIGEVDVIQCFSTVIPLMDFSVGGVDSASPSELQLIRVEGIAPDNVATVALANRQGIVTARSSTEKNVYSLSVPRSSGTAKVIALDAAGNEVFSRSFGAPPAR